MHVLIARGPGDLVTGTAETPTAGPGRVLVRVRVTAVSSGTELRMMRGDAGDPAGAHPGWPAIGAFGYLAAGDVIEVGADVTGPAVGDRVVCRHSWGAHREVLDVAADAMMPLPSGLSYVEGACAYWAVPPLGGVLAAQPRLDEDALVVGLGALGLAAVQLLAPLVRRVVAVDRVASRCERAEAFGALPIRLDGDEAVGDAVARIHTLAPGGPSVALQVAGSPSALGLALEAAAPYGRVVNVGTLPPLDGFDLFWPSQARGVAVLPISRAHRGPIDRPRQDDLWGRYLPLVLELLEHRRLDVAALCTSVVPWRLAPEAMREQLERPERQVGIAFDWSAE